MTVYIFWLSIILFVWYSFLNKHCRLNLSTKLVNLFLVSMFCSTTVIKLHIMDISLMCIIFFLSIEFLNEHFYFILPTLYSLQFRYNTPCLCNRKQNFENKKGAAKNFILYFIFYDIQCHICIVHAYIHGTKKHKGIFKHKKKLHFRHKKRRILKLLNIGGIYTHQMTYI